MFTVSRGRSGSFVSEYPLDMPDQILVTALTGLPEAGRERLAGGKAVPARKPATAHSGLADDVHPESPIVENLLKRLYHGLGEMYTPCVGERCG